MITVPLAPKPWALPPPRPMNAAARIAEWCAVGFGRRPQINDAVEKAFVGVVIYNIEVAILVDKRVVVVVVSPPGAGSCGNSSRWHSDEGDVASLAEVDSVNRLVVVVADKDPLTRP